MSSSGWTNLEVKPEVDSGFFIVAAPVMVAEVELPPEDAVLDMTEAAAGNVGPELPIVEDAADCN